MESQAPMLSLQRFYGGLSYEGRVAPVSVSVDDGANDGEADEGDDVRGLFGTVIGGEGPDTLTATRGPNSLSLEGRGGGDRLIGGESDDRLVGGPGDDVLIGAAGTDTLEGGLGGDWLSGGPGVEWVRYEDRSAPVSVTLDDRPGDGEAGEGDDVRSDIENVSGGTAGDVIVGSAGPNQLRGGAGDDTLIGGEGADTLLSGSGSNVMEGGPGTDKLYSQTRANRVMARDGERDTIGCFLRPPVLLRADPIDSLSRCAPAIGLARRGSLRATKEWTVSFRVGCLGPRINGSCLGVVSIRPEADEEIWAKGAVRLRAGERQRLTLSLRPAGRRALASGKTLRVRVVAVTRAFGRGPSEHPRIERVLLQPPVRR
jgi:RTX calcium-binding nonapeptide repeat (4 copies)